MRTPVESPRAWAARSRGVLARLGRELTDKLRRRTRRLVYRPAATVLGVRDAFVDWFEGLALSENAVLLGFAVLTGLAGAAGVIVFYRLIDLAHRALWTWPQEVVPRWAWVAGRPLATAVALAAAWFLVRRLRADQGFNVPDVQRRVAHEGAEIPLAPTAARTAASAVTIAGGGAAGSEGPVAVLGAALGTLLGRAFRFPPARRAVLAAAGVAAGIAAAFNAPLAGAFFAAEEILGAFGAFAFAPIVVSSVVASVASRAVLGNHPAFPIPDEYGYALVREIALFFPLLGAVLGVASVGFIRLYARLEAGAARLRRFGVAVPLAAGLLVGVIGVLAEGRLTGVGHLAMPVELFGRLPVHTLLLLGLAQVVATCITLTHGGSGGLFTPSLFVGAALGGAVGGALQAAWPALPIQPETYALVGMGGMVAAATGAPITAILLVFEVTGDYALMLPLMLTVVVSTGVARALEPDTLYSGWLRRRGVHLDGDAGLARWRVGPACDRGAPRVGGDVPVRSALGHLDHGYDRLPVVDGDGRLIGVLDTLQLARSARDGALDTPVRDLAQPTEALTPDDTLAEAEQRLYRLGVATLPVVDAATGRLIGGLTRARVAAWSRRLVGRDDAHARRRMAREAADASPSAGEP